MALRKTRRPRSRDHVTVCALRSWTGLADRAPRRDLGRAGIGTDPRTDEGPESAGGSFALAEPAPWTLRRSSGTNVPSGRPSMRPYVHQMLINPAHGQARRPGQCGVTSRCPYRASRPASLRVGRKGSYSGMFEFICDVVTIPIRITARSYPGFSGSAGLTCFRLALHHAKSTSSSTKASRRFVTHASWCAAPAGGGSGAWGWA